ncbi:MAG: hypothetical protein WC371_00435, partial [Parachlamydiales bacterium]
PKEEKKRAWLILTAYWKNQKRNIKPWFFKGLASIYLAYCERFCGEAQMSLDERTLFLSEALRAEFGRAGLVLENSLNRIAGYRENTMADAVQFSVKQSLQKLIARYRLNSTQETEELKDLEAFFRRPLDGLSEKQRQQASDFWERMNPYYYNREPYLFWAFNGRYAPMLCGLKVSQVLALVWKATKENWHLVVDEKGTAVLQNGREQWKKSPEPVQEEKKTALIRVLAEIQVEHGTYPACSTGTFNALVGSLMGIHPDVKIIHLTSQIIGEIIQEIAKNEFRGSSAEKQVELKRINDLEESARNEREKQVLQAFFERSRAKVEQRLTEMGAVFLSSSSFFQVGSIFVNQNLIMSAQQFRQALESMQYAIG